MWLRRVKRRTRWAIHTMLAVVLIAAAIYFVRPATIVVERRCPVRRSAPGGLTVALARWRTRRRDHRSEDARPADRADRSGPRRPRSRRARCVGDDHGERTDPGLRPRTARPASEERPGARRPDPRRRRHADPGAARRHRAAIGAGLFVSVHMDSAPNPLARGATVYSLVRCRVRRRGGALRPSRKSRGRGN